MSGITLDELVDIDIRDLSHTQDSIKIGDGVDFLAINADGSLNALVSGNVADDAIDSGNPVKVGSRAFDCLLTAVSTSNDRADLLSDMYRRIYINESANIAILNTAETVTAVAAQVVASPLAGRKYVTLQNEGSVDVYFGSSAGVTSANGLKVSKNSSATYNFGEDIDIFMIAASGSQSVRVLEVA